MRPPLPFPRKTPAATARAFTLIELLTVIAIIGILAAIIIPTVGAVRSTARRATATANLRGCFTMHQLFANDNKNLILPYASTPFGQKYGWGKDMEWMSVLLNEGYTDIAKKIDVTKTAVFGNPEMLNYYSGNQLQTDTTWSRNGLIGPYPNHTRRFTAPMYFNQLVEPSQTLLIMDGTIQPSGEWFYTDIREGTNLESRVPPVDFQKGKTMVLYADGHVLALPTPEFRDKLINNRLFRVGIY